MENEWKLINNSFYAVNKYGQVKNTKTNNLLKHRFDKYGYPRLAIRDKQGKKLYKTIHRLVAETWLDNPNNLPQVNHKDGIKSNSFFDNLEWCTVSENIIHSFDNLLNSNTNPVSVIDLEQNKEINFRSLKSLSKYINVYTSVLLPLIKNSKQNPILGRFVIKIKDELQMLKTANTGNFGRPVFVFDQTSGITTKYESTLIASYFTCIRSLGNLKTDTV